jgi:hypothetical protein
MQPVQTGLVFRRLGRGLRHAVIHSAVQHFAIFVECSYGEFDGLSFSIVLSLRLELWIKYPIVDAVVLNLHWRQRL